MEILYSVLDTFLRMLVRILPILIVSLFGTEILVQLGFMKKLEPIGKPLTRISRLPPVSTVTFITGIGSVVAANTMLATYHNNGRINDRELVLSSLLNSIPVYIKEVFTYQLPVILPLLGLWIGIIHFMTFWLSGFLKLVFIIVGGRILLGKVRELSSAGNPCVHNPTPENNPGPRPFKQVLVDAFNTQKKLFLKITVVYVIVTFIVLFCMELGLFKWVDGLVAPMTARFGLPSEVIGPVTAYIISPIVGITSMSTLLQSHQVTDYQAIVALLIGGFLMIPVMHLRYMLPKYISIFGARLGTLIILLSMGFSLSARAIMLGAVVLIYA